jgi:nitric oxide reductase activation protein
MGDDMRILRVATIGVVLATACSVRVSGGQIFPQTPTSKQGQQQIPGIPFPGRNGNPAETDPMDPHRAEQQEKMRNNDRQKRLVADTDKLLALATDLKAQVDKSTKDTLSVDVIKKAEEIEKLAHSVKERMKG